MENYYKILEVDKDASSETIEKVYKMLVKKYHPDLQNDENKENAEEKIKKVNEAYDVLSDPIKREEYNKTLIENNISYEKYTEIINENILLKNELNYIKNKINNVQNNYYQNNTQQNYNYTKPQYNNVNKNYYTNDYKKEKFKIKNLFKFIFSLLLTGIIVYILINISFIFNLFNMLFNSDISLLLIVIFIIIIYISKK